MFLNKEVRVNQNKINFDLLINNSLDIPLVYLNKGVECR